MNVTGKSSPNIYDVVDTQIHALLAKHPKKRYQVGTGAKMMCFANLLPASISDYFVNKPNLYGPLPDALKEKTTPVQND